MATTGFMVTLVALVALLVSHALHSRLGEWLTKPTASLGFLLVASPAVVSAPTPFTYCMASALVLCFVGDALLIPGSQRFFVAGLVAFLLGHVAYAAAFVNRGIDASAATLAFVAIAAVGAGLHNWLRPGIPRELLWPVRCYIVVISIMVAVAIGTHAQLAQPKLVAGALLFYLSDVCVAAERFKSTGPRSKMIGLPLYYAAQLLLASTA